MGRKSKYKKEYINSMLVYFKKEPYKKVKCNIGKNRGEYHIFPVDFPTMRGFASSIGTTYYSLRRWYNAKSKDGSFRYKEFRNAYRMCQTIQESILIINGLNGLYKSNFAIFIMKNFLHKEYLSTKENIGLRESKSKVIKNPSKMTDKELEETLFKVVGKDSI